MPALKTPMDASRGWNSMIDSVPMDDPLKETGRSKNANAFPGVTLGGAGLDGSDHVYVPFASVSVKLSVSAWETTGTVSREPTLIPIRNFRSINSSPEKFVERARMMRSVHE
jgi:hypothetical protein